MATGQTALVRVKRYRNVPDCDVVIAYRGDETLIRCRTYEQAVSWARMECKSYGIQTFDTVEEFYRNGIAPTATQPAAY